MSEKKQQQPFATGDLGSFGGGRTGSQSMLPNVNEIDFTGKYKDHLKQ